LVELSKESSLVAESHQSDIVQLRTLPTFYHQSVTPKGILNCPTT
jgi:hypothetical protein